MPLESYHLKTIWSHLQLSGSALKKSSLFFGSSFRRALSPSWAEDKGQTLGLCAHGSFQGGGLPY